MLKSDIAVIGALNADIWARPEHELILRESNLGYVRLTPGGVGRNIAHNLRLLGQSVALVSAVGDDSNGDFLLDSCKKIGIDCRYVRRVADASSCSYVYITDSCGDTVLAVNDMAVCQSIDESYLAEVLPQLDVKALVIEANLPERSIAYICKNASVPIYADTVSSAKAHKLKPYMSRLAAIKPNERELAILSERKSIDDAATELVNMGVGRVFVSLGEEGLLAADASAFLRLPAESINVLNTSGAGDAAMAAVVYAGVQGLPLSSAARLAVRAASLTCMSESSNSERLSELVNNSI